MQGSLATATDRVGDRRQLDPGDPTGPARAPRRGRRGGAASGLRLGFLLASLMSLVPSGLGVWEGKRALGQTAAPTGNQPIPRLPSTPAAPPRIGTTAPAPGTFQPPAPQPPAPQPPAPAAGNRWTAPAAAPAAGSTPAPTAARSPAAAAPAGGTVAPQQPAAPPPSPTKVTPGSGVLPNDHGQVWREYDLSPYTSRLKDTPRPEQAVIDWILRETGTEVWFAEPLGVLNATPEKLRVYHTPEMHETVRAVVDRFIGGPPQAHHLALRLVTISNPNWRAKALPLLRPVSAQSAGVDAWLLSREHAALLLAELRKRTDFREHNSPNLMVHNGQSSTLQQHRPRMYARSLAFQPNAFGSYRIEQGQLNEGYRLEISPLMSLSDRLVDAVVKCEIDQVEKLVPVYMDVPGPNNQSQRLQVQVPQMVSWRLHERFRWPANQVLLLSCGVVAAPAPQRAPLGLPANLLGTSGRADALLFVEAKGQTSEGSASASRTASGANYHGRY